MKWVGIVASLVVKHKEKKLLGSSRRKWKDNSKIQKVGAVTSWETP
jgi:hypothetical protein